MERLAPSISSRLENDPNYHLRWDNQSPEFIAQTVHLKFLEAIERRRGELQVSQSELARRMKVSRSYVKKLLSGDQQSSLLSLVKLAKALDCKLAIELAIPEQQRI